MNRSNRTGALPISSPNAYLAAPGHRPAPRGKRVPRWRLGHPGHQPIARFCERNFSPARLNGSRRCVLRRVEPSRGPSPPGPAPRARRSGAAAFAWELLEVAAQQRVEDPPFPATVVFDDPGVAQRAERLVRHVGRQSLVELGAKRDALDESLRVSAERASDTIATAHFCPVCVRRGSGVLAGVSVALVSVRSGRWPVGRLARSKG